VRQAVLETLPRRRGYSDVIGVVNAPVCAGKDLLGLIRIDDDRVDWNVRQITGLVGPGERAAICRACYLKHMAGGRRRVSTKPTYTGVPDRQRGGCRRWIERDTQHRTVGQDCVVVSNIYPVRLARNAGTETETNPRITIVGANNGDALKFR